MKKLILSFVFIATLLTASSQKVYFVYIQSESEAPFFVKISNKLHSSTSSGYLILSKLIDSTYNFSIGFPQSKAQEQKFSVIINKKDHGYLLKQFGEMGWGLYNLQTSAVQMPMNANSSSAVQTKTEKKEVTEFTEMLSKVADDPSIKEKPTKPKVVEMKPEVVSKKTENTEKPVVAVKEKVVPSIAKVEKNDNEEKVVPSIAKVEKNDNEEKVVPSIAKVEKNDNKEKVVEEIKGIDEVTEKTVEVKEPITLVEKPITKSEDNSDKVFFVDSYNPSLVKKRSESSTTEGFGLVFIDEYDNGTKDTIILVIPNPKQIEIPVTTKSEEKDEKKFIEIDNSSEKKKEETKLTEVKPVIVVDETDKQKLSNNCTEVADESDFLKLRKQMAAKESDEEMTDEAKKYFKVKCFSTGQIKNLGSLYLKDQSRYRFFDAAYNFVSDTEKFPALQSELTDEYYINRFRAMLRN